MDGIIISAWYNIIVECKCYWSCHVDDNVRRPAKSLSIQCNCHHGIRSHQQGKRRMCCWMTEDKFICANFCTTTGCALMMRMRRGWWTCKYSMSLTYYVVDTNDIMTKHEPGFIVTERQKITMQKNTTRGFYSSTSSCHHHSFYPDHVKAFVLLIYCISCSSKSST